MNFSQGKIKSIDDNYIIKHLCNTDHGSSGGPLINSIDYKVIGIHKGRAKDGKEYNLGIFLKEPINIFKTLINNKKKYKSNAK